MPKLAQSIEVIQRRNRYSLRIDGVEFPWYITDAGVEVQVAADRVPGVTITLLAETVTLDYRLGTPKDRDSGAAHDEDG